MNEKEYTYSGWQLDLYRKVANCKMNVSRSEAAKLLAVGAFNERISGIIKYVNCFYNSDEDLFKVVVNWN